MQTKKKQKYDNKRNLNLFSHRSFLVLPPSSSSSPKLQKENRYINKVFFGK